MDNRTIEQIRDNETKLIKELQQKENIIKEVREYIKESCYDYDFDTYSNMTSDEVKELLEILDKGE